MVSGSIGFVGKNLITYINEFGLSTFQLKTDELSHGRLEKIIKCDVIIHLA